MKKRLNFQLLRMLQESGIYLICNVFVVDIKKLQTLLSMLVADVVEGVLMVRPTWFLCGVLQLC